MHFENKLFKCLEKDQVKFVIKLLLPWLLII